MLGKQIGKSIAVEFRKMQKVDVSVNILDISLISKVLGWRPQIAIERH